MIESETIISNTFRCNLSTFCVSKHLVVQGDGDFRCSGDVLHPYFHVASFGFKGDRFPLGNKLHNIKGLQQLADESWFS